MADQKDKQAFSSRNTEYAIYGKNKARDFINHAQHTLKDSNFMHINRLSGEMT